MDEDNIITLNDENGNEVEFEFLDLIPYRQNEYVVLLPIGDSDGQVVILQLKEIDDETEEYVGVTVCCFKILLGGNKELGTRIEVQELVCPL